MPLNIDPQNVVQIIKQTAEIEILPLFRKLKDHEISDKASGEVVTAADIASENRLTRELTGLLPGSVTVGEEAVSDDETIMDRLSDDKPVWIIDPVDGTRNFADGKACFAVIVALALEGETIAGWIYDPIKDTMFYAEKGQGARRDNQKLILNTRSVINDMSGSVSRHRRETIAKRHNAEDIPQNMLRYGCVGQEYIDLAQGILNFAEYGMLKPWDHAAGLLLHAEAGGYSAYTDDQKSYKPEPTVRKHFLAATNKNDWQILRQFFSK